MERDCPQFPEKGKTHFFTVSLTRSPGLTLSPRFSPLQLCTQNFFNCRLKALKMNSFRNFWKLYQESFVPFVALHFSDWSDEIDSVPAHKSRTSLDWLSWWACAEARVSWRSIGRSRAVLSSTFCVEILALLVFLPFFIQLGSMSKSCVT